MLSMHPQWNIIVRKLLEGGVLLSKIIFSSVQISEMLRVFHELMNQYQACLYLFHCIFHGDSKYSIEIQKCWNFWQFW